MYEDAPGWRVLFNLFRIMYHNHPVKVEIAGTVPSIAKITDQTLYDCYKTFYDPSNMFLCLSGNVDTEKVLEMIDSKIKTTEHENIRRSDFDEPEEIVCDYGEMKMAVSMPLFVAGIKDSPSDTTTLTKKKAINNLLLEMCIGKISPLYQKLLEEGLINTHFGTEYFYSNSYAALLFEGESKDPKKVRDAIGLELKKIAENGADKDLFNDALKKLYGKKIREFSDAEEIVSGFIDCAVDGTEPYCDIKILKTLTADDITARARELSTKTMALSCILPQN